MSTMQMEKYIKKGKKGDHISFFLNEKEMEFFRTHDINKSAFIRDAIDGMIDLIEKGGGREQKCLNTSLIGTKSWQELRRRSTVMALKYS